MKFQYSNPAIYKNDNALWPGGFYARNASLAYDLKIKQYYLTYQQTKNGNNMIQLDGEKAFKNTKYPFMIKKKNFPQPKKRKKNALT